MRCRKVPCDRRDEPSSAGQIAGGRRKGISRGFGAGSEPMVKQTTKPRARKLEAQNMDVEDRSCRRKEPDRQLLNAVGSVRTLRMKGGIFRSKSKECRRSTPESTVGGSRHNQEDSDRIQQKSKPSDRVVVSRRISNRIGVQIIQTVQGPCGPGLIGLGI